MSFINWEEAEKYTSWAVAKNQSEPGDSWDKGADGWQKRIDFEKEFTRTQVDACTRIDKNTTVLDACCGTGRTALLFAQKAKHVYAVDGAPHMLEYCKRNAEKLNLDNMTIQQIYNWHSVNPAEEFPLVDIAVSVIGPPQADILNFSKFATKYCYFLSFTKDRYMVMMKELFDGTTSYESNTSFAIAKSQMATNPFVSSLLADSNRNHSNLDIYFNILYNHGVLPEVNYASGEWAHEAKTKDEIYDYLRALGKVDSDKEDIFRQNCDKRIVKLDNGLYRYGYKSQMFVLGWDPNQIKW